MRFFRVLSIAALACFLLFDLLALPFRTPGQPPDARARKSPSLTITDYTGVETQLAAFRGKVIVLEFFFVRSPHCLQLAGMLNRLNGDLGKRGFQPVAVAFGPFADSGVLVHLVDTLKLTYPVGYTSSDKVDAYLGRQGKEVLKIPQIVVIDRSGMVRASSGSHGDPSLENEAQLRGLIESLLKENPDAAARQR